MNPGALVGRTALQTLGFARYDRATVFPALTDAQVGSLLRPWAGYYDALPLDPHDRAAHRYRRYARGQLAPGEHAVVWELGIADAEFGAVAEFCSGDFNPEYPGDRRRFPYADPAGLADPLLRELIHFDVDQAVWPPAVGRSGPITVGVHFVRLRVTQAGQQAVSSPNCLHQDGGTHSNYFVHLLARDNVTGGVNIIAPAHQSGRDAQSLPKTEALAEFILHEPLDTYGVHDIRVSHYVSPIQQLDPTQPATRDALLIGLIPQEAAGGGSSRTPSRGSTRSRSSSSSSAARTS